MLKTRVLFIICLFISPIAFANQHAPSWSEHFWHFVLFDLAFMAFAYFCFLLFKQLARFPRPFRYKPLK